MKKLLISLLGIVGFVAVSSAFAASKIHFFNRTNNKVTLVGFLMQSERTIGLGKTVIPVDAQTYNAYYKRSDGQHVVRVYVLSRGYVICSFPIRPSVHGTTIDVMAATMSGQAHRAGMTCRRAEHSTSGSWNIIVGHR